MKLMTKSVQTVYAVIAVFFIHLSCTVASDQLMACPQVCSCIWRNGKQTTICENQNLISIPNQISPSTQVLDLKTNNFQILPSKAFQERGLINLQKLFLPHCKLGAIADDAFVQLTNLVELDLSDNLLTHVPVKALANATNLRRLLLNNNHIATINAESFSSLSNLKFLNLSGCQTHTIESRAFFGLNDLEYLYLHSNHLTTLPYSVVSDLPALYSFDLYRNPWHCNCEMRATREWMVRNNVGQSLPPTCELPVRLSGLMWNSLDLDDFACEPDIITTTVEVAKTVGSNATLSCVVKGLPEPKVYWYVDNGIYKNLSSMSTKEEKYHISEERGEGTVNSMLTIVGLDLADDAGAFICSAENRAGIKSKNFTIFVLPSSAFSVTANWSKVELAGGVVGILITLVLVFVLATLVLIRTKRFGLNVGVKKFANQSGSSQDSSYNEKKPSHLSLFPGSNTIISSPTYSNTVTNLHQHLSMLGLDGIDKKPEIFLNTSNSICQNGMMLVVPPPDLVAGSNNTHHLVSNGGYELNTYNNSGLTYTNMIQSNMDIDTEHMQMFSNDQNSFDRMVHNRRQQQQCFPSDTMFPPNYHPPPPPTSVQQDSDSDGLYRAVMVPSVTSNDFTSGTATNTTTTGTTGSARASPYSLSAANLYSQYLSQSVYDLSKQQQQSPATIMTYEQESNRISPELLRSYQQQQQVGNNVGSVLFTGHQSPFHGDQQTLIYGNPGFIMGSRGDLAHEQPVMTMMPVYEDEDVFHSNNIQHPVQHVLMNESSIYGVHQSPSMMMHSNSGMTSYYTQQQQPQQQQQPIYGMTMQNARWKGTTPTPTNTAQIISNIRYSPDEGYGEESSTGQSVGQLEGTEV